MQLHTLLSKQMVSQLSLIGFTFTIGSSTLNMQSPPPIIKFIHFFHNKAPTLIKHWHFFNHGQAQKACDIIITSLLIL